MAEISSLNNLIQSDVTQTAPSREAAKIQQNQQADQSDSQQTYGPPYILSISETGQPYLNGSSGDGTASGTTANASGNTNTTSSSSPNSRSADGASGDATATSSSSTAPTGSASASDSSSSGASGGGTGGGAVATGVASSETSEAEQEAKRKVEPQVGPVGANEVVDKKGNIDETKLKELIAQQEQQAHPVVS